MWSMEICLQQRVRKWMTVVGVALISSVNGVTTYYGNLLTYTNSYLLVKGHHDVTSTSALVLCAWAFTFSLSITFTGRVIKCLPRSRTLLAAILVYDVSLVLGYWVVRTSVPLFVVMHGLSAGLTTGHMLSVGSLYLIDWTSGKNLGFISSIATTTSTGALFINQLITVYVNPDNLVPDLSLGKTKYFQQEKILDWVPTLFLVLAFVSSATHLTGYTLIRELRESSDGEEKLSVKYYSPFSCSADTNEEKHSEKTKLLGDRERYCEKRDAEAVDNSGRFTDSCTEVDVNNRQIGEDVKAYKDSKFVGEKKIAESDEGRDEFGRRKKRCQPIQALICKTEMTWQEAVKTRQFYILWLGIGSAELTYLNLSAFYKSFGQTIIQDDHFLSFVAIASCVAIFFSRLLWGFLFDKLRLKTALVTYFACVSISGIFEFFTPYVSKWLFLFWVPLVAGCSASMFTVIYMSVFKCFGALNFSTIYGLVSTSGVVVILVLPFVSSVVLTYLSWSGLFLSVASMNIVSLIVVVIFFPLKYK